jgi:glycosyltransferase involved in cell wall biosynthesis
MESRSPFLSIIVPVYNEEKTLLTLLFKVQAVFSKETFPIELIIVDDCSTDKSPHIISGFLENPVSITIKTIRHGSNRGKGSAIRSGLNEAKGVYTVIQDADLEYEPTDIVRLLNYASTNKAPVVYGSRVLNQTNQYSYWSFYLGGRFISWVTNRLYGLSLTDEPTCYKLFHTPLLKSIPLTCSGFEFCPEVTAKVARLGHDIHEIDISYFPRTKSDGKKIGWKDGVIAIWILVKYRFYQ